LLVIPFAQTEFEPHFARGEATRHPVINHMIAYMPGSYAGLKAGIEGAVHALRDSWAEELNGPTTEPEASDPPEDPSIEGDPNPELAEL
jgi:hypothetical protein